MYGMVSWYTVFFGYFVHSIVWYIRVSRIQENKVLLDTKTDHLILSHSISSHLFTIAIWMSAFVSRNETYFIYLE